MYFSNEIALFHQPAKSKEEAFSILSEQLVKKEFVTEEFLFHVIEREKKFPTGLFVNGVGVAIPHTDSDYVKQSQIAFLSLEKPLVFYEMGTIDKAIDVELIFMLALKEPHEQLEMLAKLIDMFQKEEVLKKLIACKSTTDFIEIIHHAGLS